MKTITSRQNAIVARFRAATARRHGSNDILLDGVHLIQEALAARVLITHVAATTAASSVPAIQSLLERCETQNAESLVVTDTVMAAMSPVRTPSGVVALAAQPAVTLAEAFERAPQLVVAGHDVQDPGNVGAIVRAAEGGGATAVALAGASADAFGWKALRGSMGSAFRVPVVATELDTLVQGARELGLRVAATVPRGGEPMTTADLKGAILLLLGGEGPGLPDAVIADADLRVTIPMRPPVESLNVAVAAALLVYEAARQRRLF